MSIPRINLFLIGLFSLLAMGVFIAALVFPSFRQIAYAPARELILPPPEPILVNLIYSTEKEAWLEEMIAEFGRRRVLVDGHPIQVQMDKMGSREMYLAVLDGTIQPDVISPASSLQIAILEDLSKKELGRSLVDSTNRSACISPFGTPLVVVAWRDRAELLWGENPDGEFWLRLAEALTNPAGWAAFEKPEWSYIKFGHTDPTKSNSGFMTLVLMTYNFLNKTSGLQVEDILANQKFQKWLSEVEATVSEFGDSTGTYMRDIVAYGPSKYDIVSVYEATAIEQFENAVGRYGELRVMYPPATIMSDHPFCILDAEWVTPEKRQAAKLLQEFLTSKSAQEIALVKYGFRPADRSIPLDQPESPFVKFADNGLRYDLPPEAEIPAGNVLDTLLTLWIRNVQR